MQITKITDNFYQLEDVFSDTTLQILTRQFQYTDNFSKLPQGDYDRLELGLDHSNFKHLDMIDSELRIAKFNIEQLFGVAVYANNLQLWQDPDGYCNELHVDRSQNLSANVQIYLSDADSSMGTSVIENGTVYTVPYKYNCGYLLTRPTQFQHGMLNAVSGIRRSLYQSYRTTPEAVNDW